MLAQSGHSHEGSLRARNNVTHNDAPARLTEAQRESLRLVMAGYKSKEIAHTLGIGVDAVNKRLAAAKEVLGASSRFAAARQLAAWEAGQGSHSVVSQILAVEAVDPAEPSFARSQFEEANDDHPLQPTEVREPVVPYQLGHAAPVDMPPAASKFGLYQFVATPGRIFLLCFAIGVLLTLLKRL